MSTICKIAVPASDASVADAVVEYLGSRQLTFDQTDTEWPLACERDNFNIGEDFPTVLSIRHVTNEVVEVHFNSFSKVEELASHLSARTGKSVVVNVYQSVSTASYWAYHRDGRLIRALEAGDGILYAEVGERLDFEREVLTESGEDDDERYTLFDHDEQDSLNGKVGVKVEVYQDYESGWKNFVLHDASSKKLRPEPRKPWWRFW